jgi:hypothetical protein
MCGCSDITLNDKNYYLYLGHYGGQLMIDSETILSKLDTPEINSRKRTKSIKNPKEYLMSLGSETLADLIISWVKNGEEA